MNENNSKTSIQNWFQFFLKKIAINNTEYYKILGLDKSASPQDIKEAYKRLIMRLHPDKGGDPVIFKEIQNAYEVLSDPKKRKIYDEYGEEALSSREIGDNFDLSNIFHVYPPYPIPKKNAKKYWLNLI